MSTTSNDKSIGYYVAGFPNQDIFEEVIEALVKERWQMIQELYFPSYLSDERARCNGFDERATQWSTHVLYFMSLVHRTWTTPAQRAYRRCAVAKLVNYYLLSHQLRTILARPLLPFVDSLIIRSESYLIEGELQLLKQIIMYPYRRTLQNLHLELVLDSGGRKSRAKGLRFPNGAADGVACIGTLGSLKTLSFRIFARSKRGEVERNKLIDSVCYAQTHLHRLESFIILKGDEPVHDDAFNDEVFPRLHDTRPPPSLKSLCIGLGHPQAHVLSWLATPRAGYQLDHMTLFPSAQGHESELSAIRPAVPFLKSLAVDAACYLLSNPGCRFVFTETLREALMIDTLTLSFDCARDFYNFRQITMSALPPALRRLSLLFSMPTRQKGAHNPKLDYPISQYALHMNQKGHLRVIVEDHTL